MKGRGEEREREGNRRGEEMVREGRRREGSGRGKGGEGGEGGER